MRPKKGKVQEEPRNQNSGPARSREIISRRIGVGFVRLFGFSILLMGLLALGCSVPSAVSPGSPSETAPGEVRFNMAGANEAAIIVRVKINGQGPYDFVLDTGATFTCVDRQLADELKLPNWSGPLGTVIMSGEGEMGFVKIERLEVGDTASASDLVACKLDLSRMQPPGFGIQGLVGLNFLKNYRMTIDFERDTLRLDKPGT